MDTASPALPSYPQPLFEPATWMRALAAIHRSFDPQHVLHTALAYLSRLINAEFGGVFLFDENTVNLEHVTGVSSTLLDALRRCTLDSTVLQYRADPERLLPALQTSVETVLQAHNISACVFVPLVARQNPRGMVFVGTTKRLTMVPTEWLDALGEHIVVALENACRYQPNVLAELYQRTQEQNALNAIAKVLNRPLEITQSLNRVCERIATIVGMESVVVHLLDKTTQQLNLFAHHGVSPQLLAQIQRLDLNDPAVAPLIREGHSLAVDDVAFFPFPTSLAGPRAEGYRAGIGVPILQRGKPIGTIYVGTRIKSRYRQSDVDLVQNIANQIGVALENADLYAQMQRRMLELEGLSQLSATCVAQNDPQALCHQAVEWTKKILGVNVCVLRLVEDGKLRLGAGVNDLRMALQTDLELDTLRRQVIEGCQTFVVNDTMDADLPLTHRQEFERLGLRAFLAVPLSMQARSIGLLAVGHQQPHVWRANEIELLRTIANQVGIALEQARLNEQMRQRLQELEALTELSAALVSNLDARAVAEITADWLYRLFRVDVADLRIWRNGYLELLAQRVAFPEMALAQPLALGDLQAHFVERQEPLIIHDILQGEMSIPLARELMLPRGLRALVVVPMTAHQQMIGTLSIVHSEPRRWTPRELDLLRTMANHVANALDNAQLYQNALAEKRKVQAIFDSGLSGLFVTDAQGRVVMFNRAAERITGWTFEEIERKDWEEYFSDRAAGNPMPSLLEQALQEKKTLFAFEGRQLRTKDGRIIPVARAAAPLLDEHENVVGAVGAFWDLSKELRAEIEYKNFLAIMAHQIRTPLTSLLSALELLERQKLSRAHRTAVWKTLKAEGENLRRLADQFLVHQRVMQGASKVQLQPMALLPLVREVVRKFRLRYPEFRFHTRYLDKPLVYADEQYVTDILQNLLDNAVAYSASHPSIYIRVQPFDSEWVVVAVQDFGVGIPLSEQQYLFQPFYRVPQTSTRRVYGHGLGLSIVKEMVEAMGGKVWVKSDTGKGATFSFTLRRVQ